ncbi:MAG TPA: acetyl-CoA carboxylase carboxyltransferase subunit alpha [Acidobacteriota bacterium]|nr:acetyl-CoA carboxylase carboxyltransferase subunit alpha [Acidobacteriota bacterium]
MFRKAEELEKPIRDLEQQIAELQQYPESMQRDVRLERLEEKLDSTRREIYSNLSRWQTTLVARHPQRPHTLDYIAGLCRDFVELHGDRFYRDDPAIVAGLASFEGRPVAVVGHQKGRSTKEKLHRNFGMPNPEGYRKALRVMQLAEKFGNPVLTLIDTPGAYPGSGAEERGVAESIAMNLREMAGLRVPIIASVIGEGGSGGALAIGVADRVSMLEHAVYSVISPESCSSILWRDAEHAEEAADALRLAAPDLVEMGIVDEIVGEPIGGAHVDHEAAIAGLGDVLRRQLAELEALDIDTMIAQRYEKFRAMGTVAPQ